MKRQILILLFVLIVIKLDAQETWDSSIIENNKIRIVEGYVYEDENSSDSMLITKEYFNIKGYRTKIEIHDLNGIKCEYSYNYKNDTVKIKRMTKCGNNIAILTKYKYDSQNREIGGIDYTSNNERIGTFWKIKYNDKKRTKTTKNFLNHKIITHQKETYDKEGNVILYSKKKGRKWKRIEIKEGINPLVTSIEINENFNQGDLTQIIHKERILKKKKVLGLNGNLELNPNDVLTIERYENGKGLIEYEIHKLNGKYIGKKKYKYAS